MISRLGFFCFAGILFFLQGSVLPILLNGQWQPDLWLAAVTISVLVFNKRTAFAFALTGGILQDIVTANFFGAHIFPYLMIMVLTMGLVRDRYNRQWFISVMAVMAGTGVYILLLWLVVCVSGGTVRPLYYFFYDGIPQVMMNAAAAVVLHPVLWDMKREWEPKW